MLQVHKPQGKHSALERKKKRKREGLKNGTKGQKKNGVRWSRHPSYNFGGSAEPKSKDTYTESGQQI